MFDIRSKIKRQIEILSFCISNKEEKISISDLAFEFDVDEITIKRDLQDLRSYGIDVHSKKKTGVKLCCELNEDILKNIILQFVGLSYTDASIDRSTMLLVSKYNYNALIYMVKLQYCIDNSKSAIISYNKLGIEVTKNIKINPVRIFQSENTWRVLSFNGGSIKQYRMDKIEDITLTDETFGPIPKEKVEELFENSWKSFLSKNKYKVKLEFSEEWAERILPRMWIANQKITQEPDGKILFEVTVNSLNEINSWIVSRGRGCKVLEPQELKEMVMNTAADVLENYKN